MMDQDHVIAAARAAWREAQRKEELPRYRVEDSDADRRFYAMQADHFQALKRAEEEGYEKGLRDARNLKHG
jgi:hypothetical protein